jgi:hypothetical protein
MSIEGWKAIAMRFGRKYGVAVYIGGREAKSTHNAIYLPGDVPPNMIDALHGLFLHEKEHILQKDHDFAKAQDKTLGYFLNVVADIHNDNLVMEQDPGAEGLYRTVTEYIMSKNPQAVRDSMSWKQKAVQELLNRGLPRSVKEGYHWTGDPKVKHFFKRHHVEIRQLLRDMKDLRPKRVEQVKWSKWLLEKLFEDIIDPDLRDALGQGGKPLPQAIIDAIGDAITAMGGLIPQAMDMHDFECLAPGDLHQKVPEAVTVQRLKEFLTEQMEEVKTSDDGGLDPAKLPTYWNGDDNIFQQEQVNGEKKVRVHMMLDASGSMNEELGDGNKKLDALCRATGLVAQAVDRIKRDSGLDISLEAYAFASTHWKVKGAEERWDPYEFKSKYWRGGGSTYITKLVEQVAAVPDEEGTRDVCIVITDGAFDPGGKEALKEARDGKKKWVLVGLGDDLPDNDPMFRFVAKSMDEIEYILCQTIKEATV